MELINGLALISRVRVDYTSGGQRRPVCKFRCTCGAEFETRLYSVRSGKTRSCGCAHSQPRTHGAASGGLSPEYRSYRNMLTRGRNPKFIHADRYVLRGIGIAEEWLPGGDGQGFMRFLAHVGPRPSEKHSLDRIDNDRGYEPGNVRWATQTEQARNTSSTRMLTVGGETQPLQTWAERHGISPTIILQRITKLGWDVERAVSTPPKPDCRRNKQPGV